MPLKFQRPEDVSSASYLRLGIFGQNGNGKTHFLSTIPDDILTLVVSADTENVKPLRGHKNIVVHKIGRWDEMKDVLEFCGSPQNKFQCLAFDTWTRCQELAQNMIVGYEPRSIEDAMRYAVQAPKLPKGYDSWQSIGALAAEWMTYFCQLPLHTIFLMQEDNRRKDEEGHTLITPALTPWALRRAMTILETVGWLYVVPEGSGDGLALALESDGGVRAVDEARKDKRMLLIGKHPAVTTKGDSARLGHVIDNPCWTKVAAVLG